MGGSVDRIVVLEEREIAGVTKGIVEDMRGVRRIFVKTRGREEVE